ncbi:MAG: SLATT domain-containing protein [Chloroflexota bacterium]
MSSRARERDVVDGTPSDKDLRVELRNEANRILIDAEYTGRQHMLMGQWWRQRQTWIGFPLALITAAASASAGISALLGWGTALTVILGFAGALAGAINLFFRPNDQAKAHAGKGAQLIALRNEARRFMEIDMKSTLSTDALTDRVRSMSERYDRLRASEPVHLPPWTYPKAKAQIDAGNYDYESDPLWRQQDG